MLNFSYEARNPKTGKKIKATVQAENEQAANKLIKSQGFTPISIKAEGSGMRFRFGGKIKIKDKVLFSRQLATLINAGLPLVQSLRNVSGQTSKKSFKIVINQVINDVEAGLSFSDALAKHPTVFNRVYVALVAASETSGTLDEGLERLAIQQEKDADIISKVRGAMIYPLIVLAVMTAVVVFMVVKVLPQVETIYAGLPNVSLPFVTRILLAISHFIIDKWWVLIVAIVLIGFGFTRWARTMGGRSVLDKIKMKTWPIGKLFMKMYMARFARTATTLVASGVPIIQVLEITADAVNNVHISKSLHGAIEKVKGGKSLSESLQGDENFLELVPNMLSIGEDSGAMETMLGKVADYYEKEVDNEIKAISTIIEPVMMIIMGIIAITIVAAILLPVYGLVNQSGFTGGQ